MGLRAAFCRVFALALVALALPAAAINCTVSCTVVSDTFALPPAAQPTQCKLFNSGALVVASTVVSSGGGVACSFARTVAEGVSVSYTASAVYPTGESAQSSPLVFTSSAGPPPPPPPPPPGNVTLGETAILANDDSGNGNLLVAQSATLAQQATLVSMSFYVVSAAGNLRLGVYDSTGPGGGPGAKKAETASFAAVAGWNTAVVTTQPLLAPGTYWLAYLPSSGSLSFKNAPPGSVKYYSFAFGPLPTTFSTAPNVTGVRFSLYATLSTGSQTLPPPTNVRLSP